MLVGPAGSPSNGTMAMGTAVPAPPTISMVSWACAKGSVRRNSAASATVWRNERYVNTFLLDPFAALRPARIWQVADYNEGSCANGLTAGRAREFRNSRILQCGAMAVAKPKALVSLSATLLASSRSG